MKRLIFATVAGVSVIALAGCGSSGGGADDLTTVNIAYSTTSALSAAPFAVAVEKGYFADHGCKLGEQIEGGLGGSTDMRNVIDGGLDMGEVATNAVIESYLAGTPVTVVGSSHQYPYDVWYAVRKGDDIHRVEDLVGKKIGFTNPGSASEDIDYLMENAAGLSDGQITHVPTNGLGGGLAMLEGNEVDATLIIPLLYEQNKDKYDVGFESMDYVDAYQKTVYIASNDFLEKNPDAVRCLLAGVNDAMEFIVGNPKEAAEIYAAENEDYTVEQLTQELELAVEKGALDGTVGFNVTGLENVALARKLRTGDDVDIEWAKILDPSYLPDGVATELPKE